MKPSLNSPERRIGLLGASGYTGRLVVQELQNRSLSAKIGVRSEEKLALKLGEIGVALDKSLMQVEKFDVSNEADLDAFVADLDVLITTVGPFSTLGEPVVAACAKAGVHYVDSTGEPAFMQHIYEKYSDAQCAIVPACGNDYIPGDLVSYIACQDVEATGDVARKVVVYYKVSHMAPTRGTLKSALGALATSGDPGELRSETVLGLPVNTLEIPWGEEVTVGLHHKETDVSCRLIVNHTLGSIAGWATPLMRLAVPILERGSNLVPEGPSISKRKQAAYQVVATCHGDKVSKTVAVVGKDIYGSTAKLLVEAALRVSGKGAMAPAQALDAETFLDSVTGKDPEFLWKRIDSDLFAMTR
ncbi:MAG: NAD(P)H-binding protein [Acidimicrobiales bacterium]|nr:NAD(P)H-binding protein [Acidimicrobiales bacterium]